VNVIVIVRFILIPVRVMGEVILKTLGQGFKHISVMAPQIRIVVLLEQGDVTPVAKTVVGLYARLTAFHVIIVQNFLQPGIPSVRSLPDLAR
jgi:hypothetical protein